MKKKSIGVTILALVAVFIFNVQDAFGPTGIAIVGIIYSTIIMLLKRLSNSGVWLSGMSSSFWSVNILGICIMVFGEIVQYAELFNLSDQVLIVISKTVIVLNSAILTMGTTTEMLPGDRTLLAKKE